MGAGQQSKSQLRHNSKYFNQDLQEDLATGSQSPKGSRYQISGAKIHKSGIVDVKKVLGRSFDDEDVQELKRGWTHKIVKGENNRCMISVDGLEGMKTAEELVADIIEALCKLAN